jgi:hypothetical protein
MSIKEYLFGFAKFVPWHVAARRYRKSSDLQVAQRMCARYAMKRVGVIIGDNVSLRANDMNPTQYDKVKEWVESHPDASRNERRTFAESAGIKIMTVTRYRSRIIKRAAP